MVSNPDTKLNAEGYGGYAGKRRSKLLFGEGKKMKPQYRYDIKQNTLAWWKIKHLSLSGSNATAIANCGKGLNTLVNNMIRDNPQELFNRSQTPLNDDTERGKNLEGEAIKEYEKATKTRTRKVGFIKYNNNVGCSPDFLVGKDGGGEVKCRNLEKHNKIVATNKISSSTMWQIQMCLLVSGRDWWDFVAYNMLADKQLVVIRVYPNQDKFNKLLRGIEIGINLIKSKINKKLW